MRQMGEESLWRKRLVTDISLDKAMFQDVLAKKSWLRHACANGSRIYRPDMAPAKIKSVQRDGSAAFRFGKMHCR